MSIETISFLIGAALIAVAVLGGGIEVREIKVPPIGTVGRALAFLFGAGFVGLTLYLRQPAPQQGAPVIAQSQAQTAVSPPAPQPVVPASPAPTVEATTTTRKTFDEPMHNGLRTDVCYEFGKRCGEEAATAWCKIQGFDRAARFETENVGARGLMTRIIGPNAECRGEFCAAFKLIECERA